MCRCAGRGNVHCVGGKLHFDFDICHCALLMLHALLGLSGLITDVLHLKPEAPEPELAGYYMHITVLDGQCR